MQAPTRPRPINVWLYLGIPLATALALVLLELTSVDMDIATLFYDPVAGAFIGRHSYWLENILHDRVKQGVIVLGVVALVVFALSFFYKRLFGWRRELGCLMLALSLSTAFVTPLKKVTQVQCPWSLTQFGGKETYSKLLEPRPATDKPGLCWPGAMRRPDSACSGCSSCCATGAHGWREWPWRWHSWPGRYCRSDE